MMLDATPEARAWRREQADVDADIEGLTPSDPEDIAFDESLDTLDISHEEKIARMKAYFIAKHEANQQATPDAAE